MDRNTPRDIVLVRGHFGLCPRHIMGKTHHKRPLPLLQMITMDKKGIVTHPVSMFLVAVIIGMVLAILWAQGFISVPFPFCN